MQLNSSKKKESIRKNSGNNILGKLFLSTFYLSAFTFGGGYVIISLMKKKFVDEYKWIEEEEMLDMVSIAQSSPGAIAVNGAIVIGYRLAGVAGAVTAILATILPPFIIITAVSFFYNAFQNNVYIRLMLEGMEAGVGAVIASVTVDMLTGIAKQKKNRTLSVMILLFAFVLNFVFGISAAYIVLICIGIGLIKTFADYKTGGRGKA